MVLVEVKVGGVDFMDDQRGQGWRGAAGCKVDTGWSEGQK